MMSKVIEHTLKAIIFDGKTPTVNGRIYSREIGEQFVVQINSKHTVYVTSKFLGGIRVSSLMNEVIGRAYKATLDTTGRLSFKIEFTFATKEFLKGLLEFFSKNMLEILPLSEGNYDGDIVVQSAKLLYLYIHPIDNHKEEAK